MSDGYDVWDSSQKVSPWKMSQKGIPLENV